jgi:hypothetical protein
MIVLSLTPDYPLEPCDLLVIDSREDLFWYFCEDPPDLGKNVFRGARCESCHLTLQMARQEEVARCNIWRIGWMDSLRVNFLSRPVGIVSSCIVTLQIDTSKGLSASDLT